MIQPKLLISLVDRASDEAQDAWNSRPGIIEGKKAEAWQKTKAKIEATIATGEAFLRELSEMSK